MTLPPAIAQYLITLATQARAIAYVQVTPAGHIVRCGGQVDKYGLQAAVAGELLSDRLPYLAGFFPHAAINDVIPHIHTEQDFSIDVHLMSWGDEQWVVLLESSAEMKRQQQVQQQGNELRLLRHAYAKVIHQALHSATVPDSINEPKYISILTAQIIPTANQTNQHSRSDSDQNFNRDFAHISQTILEAGGLIHHIWNQELIAIFGLLTDSNTTAIPAIMTAQRLVQARPNNLEDGEHSIAVGCAIATGKANLETLSHSGTKVLHATGTVVSSIHNMSGYISPNSIVIDALTLQTIGLKQTTFKIHPVERTPLYRLIPK